MTDREVAKAMAQFIEAEKNKDIDWTEYFERQLHSTRKLGMLNAAEIVTGAPDVIEATARIIQAIKDL